MLAEDLQQSKIDTATLQDIQQRFFSFLSLASGVISKFKPYFETGAIATFLSLPAANAAFSQNFYTDLIPQLGHQLALTEEELHQIATPVPDSCVAEGGELLTIPEYAGQGVFLEDYPEPLTREFLIAYGELSSDEAMFYYFYHILTGVMPNQSTFEKIKEANLDIENIFISEIAPPTFQEGEFCLPGTLGDYTEDDVNKALAELLERMASGGSLPGDSRVQEQEPAFETNIPGIDITVSDQPGANATDSNPILESDEFNLVADKIIKFRSWIEEKTGINSDVVLLATAGILFAVWRISEQNRKLRLQQEANQLYYDLDDDISYYEEYYLSEVEAIDLMKKLARFHDLTGQRHPRLRSYNALFNEANLPIEYIPQSYLRKIREELGIRR